MRPQVLLVAALTAVTSALEERDLKACSSVALKLLPSVTAMPTPASTLADFIAQQTQFATLTDMCVIPVVTGSLSAEFTSYASKLSSWYVGINENLSSLSKACSDVPEISKQLTIIPQSSLCQEVKWASQTGSASSNKDTKGSTKDNAAARQGGMAVAAAAVAGLAIAAVN